MILAADVLNGYHASLAEWIVTTASPDLIADLGAGVGALTCSLAATDENLRVIAVDPEPAMGAALLARAAETSLSDRITLLERSLMAVELPEPVDVVVASHVVHHLPDQQAALGDLHRHVAPGGRLVLVEGGMETSCLPWDLGVGRPGLETRLAAAADAWLADHREQLNGAVRAPVGWCRLLEAAGWHVSDARTFLAQHHPPIPDAVHRFIVTRFEHILRQRRLDRYLASDDVDVLRRLTDPADDAFLGQRTDLHFLFAATAYVAN